MTRLLPIRAGFCLLLALPAAMLPAVAHADTPAPETTEARLRRIEGELRAVQRKVFPDGAGKTFAPEIAPAQPATGAPVATGNAGALADVLSRLDAVEAQVKTLTATTEDNQNRMAKLEDRLSALEAAQKPAAPVDVTPPAPVPAPDPAPAKPTKPTAKPAAKPADATAPSTPVSADHAAALAAIERPQTDDKGEDTYTYGYRLWEAKFYPEAEAALVDFSKDFPKHKRISYARNLLGRVYLDDNKPGAAAQWFVQNYLADKAGERAPDSLLYLAVAMVRLKETGRACKALGEFKQTYPDDATGRLKGQYDAISKTVTCH